MPERQYVIRRKVGLPVWLKRENPIAWDTREHALIYATENEARQCVVRLGLNATVIVELASGRN